MVRTGRFGLYVTDGETNATLRLGDTPETISLDRACELLAERRNAEPSSRPRKATKVTKKATKKVTKKGAKTTTKKSAPKKATGTAKRAAVAQGAQSNAALIAATHSEE